MSEETAVGVLVSGRGSNLKALIEASTSQQMAGRLAVVISNKPQVQALEHAKNAGIPAVVIERLKNETPQQYDTRLVAELEKHGVELVVLAGFMRIVSPILINRFKNHIVNIHPSLLPAFPGLHAQRQAIEHGVKVSGCTVHVVDEGCDTGPIILQKAVPVEPGDTVDTLAARILIEEHRLYPKAVDLMARNKVKISGRKVILEDPS